MKRKTFRRRSRRKIHRGGFGAAEYVSSITGNTISQQYDNIGNGAAPWVNSHSQGLSDMYQGGRRKRRRRTFRRRR